ncbi:MAG: hypothetical protein ACFFD4_32185 [Candidatus Odinarchaeota archaeon]
MFVWTETLKLKEGAGGKKGAADSLMDRTGNRHIPINTSIDSFFTFDIIFLYSLYVVRVIRVVFTRPSRRTGGELAAAPLYLLVKWLLLDGRAVFGRFTVFECFLRL